MALSYREYDNGEYHSILTAAMNFAISHGIIFLCSIVHHIPTARPYNWLIIYMRVCLLLLMLMTWFHVEEFISDKSND
eukprot:UN14512